MNEMIELLSRYLDDDLAPSEAAELRARLARDPALADELDALRQLRDLVATLGAAEEPPALLDELIEPLRRERAPQPVVRPGLRWLATAALLVLGLAVGVQVYRQQSGPIMVEPTPAPATPRTPGEYFQLRPLPAGEASDDAPLGASDRLLQEAPPEPTLETLEPVPPMGPLPEGTEDDAEARGAGPSLRAERRSMADAATPAPAADERDAVASHKAAPSGAADGRLELPAVPGAEARVLPALDLPPGRYLLVLELDFAGRVTAARPQAAQPSANELAAAHEVVGLQIAGAPPGEHRGVLVVGSAAVATPAHR